MSPLLAVEHVDARYRTAQVLFDVSFEVEEGSVMAFLGRNGAGKSTTMKAILGVEVEVEGRITFGGQEITRLATYERARRGIQLVPEDRRIYGDLTVRENLQLARHATGARTSIGVSELVDTLPMLASLLDRRGTRLSGGEQQAVAIARAMVAGPSLLIMDEPSIGLAPIIVQQVGEGIVNLCRRFGTTVLLPEQNAAFALGLADRVTIIEEGRIVFSGRAAEFNADKQLQDRHLGLRARK